MPKQKPSRDQKRKLKKRKQKQRKKQQQSAQATQNTQRPVRMRLRDMVEVTTSPEPPGYDFDQQEERLRQIFGTEEVPSVEADTLRTYFNYLKDNLEVPCLLTGIESMGYFGWEERFDFGYGSQAEYERLRKERGSYHDSYDLEQFEAVIDEVGWNVDIIVNVKRTTDGNRFTIPLSELEAVDQASDSYVLLNDYTVWMVNWR